jgi:hypothetical protein
MTTETDAKLGPMSVAQAANVAQLESELRWLVSRWLWLDMDTGTLFATLRAVINKLEKERR